jgi:hypothetical protein
MIMADSNGGTLTISGTLWRNTGIMGAAGGTLSLAGTSSSIGSFTLTGGSTLNFSSGTLTLGAASSVSGDGNVLFSGGTTFIDGTVAGTGGIMILSGATVSGFGTLMGNVSNAGQINPGRIDSAGVLTIIGNYTQTTTGILTIDIGGLTAGSDFDQLSISGQATLDGTVSVSLINGFRPNADDGFSMLTFASRSGDFMSRSGFDLGGGLMLVESFSATSLTLVANQTSSPRSALGAAPDRQPAGVASEARTLAENKGSHLMGSLALDEFFIMESGNVVPRRTDLVDVIPFSLFGRQTVDQELDAVLACSANNI